MKNWWFDFFSFFSTFLYLLNEFNSLWEAVAHSPIFNINTWTHWPKATEPKVKLTFICTFVTLEMNLVWLLEKRSSLKTFWMNEWNQEGPHWVPWWTPSLKQSSDILANTLISFLAKNRCRCETGYHSHVRTEKRSRGEARTSRFCSKCKKTSLKSPFPNKTGESYGFGRKQSNIKLSTCSAFNGSCSFVWAQTVVELC